VRHKAKATRRGESELWKWLDKVLGQLGHDGMSSEDSEIEDRINLVLRVRAMPWRREMGNELAYIDAQRVADKTIFGRQGMKPMKRIRGEGKDSKREPVEGLPSAFYNSTWLHGAAGREVKAKVSKMRFAWMNCVWVDDIDDGDLADSE
jgi:hypothetical protein